MGNASHDRYPAAHAKPPGMALDSHLGLPIRTDSIDVNAQPLPRLVTGNDVRSTSEISTSKGHHHRGASIVHGIPHSRTSSAATASPDSVSLGAITRAAGEWTDTMGDSLVSASSTLVADRSSSTASEHLGNGQRRVERMQSRSRREHGRQQSSSKHKGEKTVGEYALHVLFTSVGSTMLGAGMSFSC